MLALPPLQRKHGQKRNFRVPPEYSGQREEILRKRYHQTNVQDPHCYSCFHENRYGNLEINVLSNAQDLNERSRDMAVTTLILLFFIGSSLRVRS